jgi:hypothetical protein
MPVVVAISLDAHFDHPSAHRGERFKLTAREIAESLKLTPIQRHFDPLGINFDPPIGTADGICRGAGRRVLFLNVGPIQWPE